jgi:hypothetical protein
MMQIMLRGRDRDKGKHERDRERDRERARNGTLSKCEQTRADLWRSHMLF